MADLTKDKILSLVLGVVRDTGQEINNASLLKANSETILYGPKSHIDSLTFVRVITEIEERLGGELGRDILIINESTLEQKESPFGTVGLLVDYISGMIN